MTDSQELSFGRAVNQALAEEMARDDTVFLMGEDIGAMGGIFGVTRGLQEQFGAHRVRDTAIVEHFLIGGAVGAAIAGTRPVVELQFADFLLLAGDETFHKMAKWRWMHGNHGSMPIVVRAATGMLNGAGAEHSQSIETYLWHTAGLKIAVPSTPSDAKALLKAAIRLDDPVIFLEHKRLYRTRGQVAPNAPDDDETIRFGEGLVRRAGDDITIVAWMGMLPPVMSAAEQMAAEGISVEVFDPRTLVPFDWDLLLSSVRRTRRLLIVHEAPLTAGPGAEIAAHVAESTDSSVLIRRLGGRDRPIPQNAALERFCYPQTAEIVEAVRSSLS